MGGVEKVVYKELIALLEPEGRFELDWQEIDEQIDRNQIIFQEELYRQFQLNTAGALLFLGFSEKLITSESLGYLGLVAGLFVRKLSKCPDVEILREKILVDLESEDVELLLKSSPFLNGVEYLDRKWIANVWDKLNHEFSSQIKSYKGSVTEYFASITPNVHIAGRVYFHLVESKNEGFPFAFLATYSGDISKDGKSKHLPLKNALVEYGNNSRKLLELLSTVNKVSERSAFIAELVDTGEIFHPLGLDADEAYTFLKEIPVYEEAGVLCRMPNWWKNKSESLKIAVSVGNKAPSYLDFDALVDFDAQLSLGGENITIDELKKLMAEAEGFAFIKGKWVEVNHEKLKESLRAYEQAQKMIGKSDISMIEAMYFQLNAQKIFNVSGENCDIEVTNGEWLNSVIARLTHPDIIETVTCGDDFHASLRTYQERGLNWLHLMKTLGLGACLADDMGLGKTVQVIALLNYVRSKKDEKTLLIIPASLIGNWMNELIKFAPSLKYYIIHSSENKNIGKEDRSFLGEHDLFITTYAMIVKSEWIKEVKWDLLILDEAQAIKNPGTKQTRAVKQIKASYKIAMTGTPIENRLSDLWSLFDFLNKGLLGSAKEFTDFTRGLKESREGTYKVDITIKSLNVSIWESITKACEGEIDSLQELIDGKFPKVLSDMFTIQGKGLFPSPKEISFECSCPDWANMCKHVAAVLYGVGARLDDNPTLFFLLRNVEIDDLISDAINNKSYSLIEKSKTKSGRVIEDTDISNLFGIDIEDDLKTDRK
jgi:hypothetical protein